MGIKTRAILGVILGLVSMILIWIRHIESGKVDLASCLPGPVFLVLSFALLLFSPELLVKPIESDGKLDYDLRKSRYTSTGWIMIILGVGFGVILFVSLKYS